jgi:hypothetical protein
MKKLSRKQRQKQYRWQATVWHIKKNIQRAGGVDMLCFPYREWLNQL